MKIGGIDECTIRGSSNCQPFVDGLVCGVVHSHDRLMEIDHRIPPADGSIFCVKNEERTAGHVVLRDGESTIAVEDHSGWR